ncbi:Hypothetical predicted protein [Pelobates cultripes]|uniref:Uncharacterized protein n=1 Tax=Pelobates cultripes TaxID=61616 RepID=A0AAD1SBW2_PELCU|nr:Hypothetical predicted protein [Pelobates cultripes]
MNVFLLSDPEIIKQIGAEILQCFATNDSPGMKANTTWAAHKAVIRGALIRQSTRKKKQKSQTLERLLSELRTLEQAHQFHPDGKIFRHLDTVRHSIQALLLDDTAKAMTYSRRTFY